MKSQLTGHGDVDESGRRDDDEGEEKSNSEEDVGESVELDLKRCSSSDSSEDFELIPASTESTELDDLLPLHRLSDLSELSSHSRSDDDATSSTFGDLRSGEDLRRVEEEKRVSFDPSKRVYEEKREGGELTMFFLSPTGQSTWVRSSVFLLTGRDSPVRRASSVSRAEM